MKKFFNFFVLAGVLAIVATSCYKDDIDNLQKQIDALKSGEIATIETQISSINTSITELKSVDNTLKEYITALQSDSKKYAQQIADLTAMDKTLETKIADLQKYVDSGIKDTKDWASATFATLDQMDSVATVVAKVVVGVKQISENLDSLKKEVTGGYTKAIEAATTKLETSMKKWVSEQLADYYTIAKLNAVLDSLGKKQSDIDSAMVEKIKEQQVALDTAKSQITAAYKKAIQVAIDSLQGKFDIKIATEIATAKNTLQTQIDTISGEISNIKSRLSTVETNISALINQIQSIAVIPTYSDGSVKVISCGYVDTISFDIYPTIVAQAIATTWQGASTEVRTSMVSFNLKEVATKVQDVASATVDTVFFKDGEFKVGVRFQNLPANAMASLHIASGKSDLSSGYLLLNVVDLTGQHGILNEQEYVFIKAKYNGTDSTYLKWATDNLAVTTSGQAKWKTTNYLIGDYFQWAASYDGYGLDGSEGKEQIPANLVLYTSFTNTGTSSGNSFNFKGSKEFNQANAPYYDGSAYTKYTSGSATLDLKDDAANIVLGGTWRMPTGGSDGEFKAMYDATKWTWDDTDKGYYVTKSGESLASDKSNALLFFPAAGYGGGTTYKELLSSGEAGYSWSGSLRSDQISRAHYLYFTKTYVGPGLSNYRYYGFQVRPVSN